MNKSLYKKVSIASLIMMASVFLSRLIGLLREIVIAYKGGTSLDVDAYQIAFVIPEILNHIVASGFLSVTFIPIFSEYLSKNKEEEGWKVFSIIFNGFGSMLILFIIICEIFAPQLVSITAPGIKDPLILEKAIRMTRIIIPAQFFFFAGGMFMAVQFSKEKFSIPALAPLVYNLGIIIGGIMLSPLIGIEGFSWGVLAGAFIGNFMIQAIGAKKSGLKFKLIFNLFHPDLKKYIFLTLPLILGLSMTFSAEFFLRYFGTYLSSGSIAALNYSLRVMLILSGIFGQAIGTASFPFMARLFSDGKIFEMNQLLNKTLKYLCLVIPFSVLFIILRHEIIFILFQRGKFDSSATQLTSNILICIMPGAFAFATQTVVSRAYYAMQNTIFPAIFGTMAVISSIPIYMIGIKIMQAQGVAAAISVSAFLQVFLLFILWNKKTKNKEAIYVYSFFTKIIFISLIIGLLSNWLKNNIFEFFNNSTLLGNMNSALLNTFVFVFMLLTFAYIFGIKEFSEIGLKLLKKIRKKT
ncbi:MAG: murein biosynthesis integral membrane protein MurJ [Desulfobacterales bacterium]|nr:murein biosynthesis integral membrane protein MurJ [Desulfobacterales bacterium]